MIRIVTLNLLCALSIFLLPLNAYSLDCDYYAGDFAGRNNLAGSFTWENDSFDFDKEDEWYTNGMKWRYVHNEACTDALFYTYLFRPFVKGFLNLNPTDTSWGFGMNMYTPNQITTPRPQLNDRPWDGWLYGSQYLTWISTRERKVNGLTRTEATVIYDLELQLGVLGSWAQQDRIQEAWHALIHAPTPRGWDNQREGKFGISSIYTIYMRMYGPLNPSYQGSSLSSRIGITTGNVTRYGTAGITGRLNIIGLSYAEFSDDSVGIATPTGGPITQKGVDPINFSLPKIDKDGDDWNILVQRRKLLRNKPILGIFINADARFVQYSHFLEGTNIEIENRVYELEPGIVWKFPNSNHTYQLSVIHRSPEFRYPNGQRPDSITVARFAINYQWDTKI